mmetsp:Transcript_14731/g.16679  ORF Transcript_14731/g.16679 Transcript_14731/m.16679 type:complete len:308 (-) Transcript_14731:187-1110(-)|eukprot:CAMPEP_0184012522 /NCGR_PEP_ID=MMETSP0954-20121128/4466_1 /TAXON_ID=627963 /ORGANISM="Aplanochytrium sp, Strain PBS07" /LENGTH=307 /DNA_ID=CAMNT_0026292533 /DNA_START=184 /DNA_END=1107 /DNA_ORIENTATION=-
MTAGKSSLKLEGVYTALITPFTTDGLSVDFEAFENLVDSQIVAGLDGLIPMGTTGESPTCTKEEKEKCIKICVDKCKSKGITVIAGTGSNNTASTVKATEEAKALGVDAVLIVNPYYNKPSQAGLYRHIGEINKVGVPIVLYNIPGRTGITMSAETIAKCYRNYDQVVAVKESTGSLDLASEIASLCDITILSGDDSLALPLISIGGKGVVSVLSNWKPNRVQKIVKNALKGDFAAAAENQKKNIKLLKAMSIETIPVPVKYVMHLDGLCQPSVRLPLVELEPSSIEALKNVCNEYGLIAEEPATKK